jgi:LPXTG-site transpeptidase (sortase) family protein
MQEKSTTKRKALAKHIVSILAKFTLGLGIICFLVVFNMLMIRTFPIPKPIIQQSIAAQPTPIEVIILDANIDVPIVPATITQGVFATTDKGASFLTSSPLPGEKGNSIIYAHNWMNLFGNLNKVKKGEYIEIVFSDKRQKKFTITGTKTVTAHEISILQPTNDKRLTLFTCANFLDADRFVVEALADK